MRLRLIFDQILFRAAANFQLARVLAWSRRQAADVGRLITMVLVWLVDARYLEVVSFMGGPLHERIPTLLLEATTDY